MKRPTVLLSTYNGEAFVEEQLRSLAEQTVAIDLMWRDDGSSDCTRELVRAFCHKNALPLQEVEGAVNVGVVASFGELMRVALCSRADLFFFCDQDDVWHPNKIERMCQAFPKAGAEETPMLAHHDLTVVSADLCSMHPSLWQMMRLDVAATTTAALITRNNVTGCAAAFNRQLLEAAVPIADGAIMHDWWCALIASAYGDIRSVPEALVQYRQHGANTLGAKSFFSGLNPFTNWFAGWRRGNEEFRALFPQARGLLARLEQKAPVCESVSRVVEEFLAIPHKKPFDRVRSAYQMGLRDRSPLLLVVALLRVLTTRV